MKFEWSAAVVLLFSQQAGAFSLGAERSASSRASVTQLFAEKPRVVVTGLGVVNGCGIGHENFFKACLDGVCSIDVVKRFDASYMPCSIASEIPDEMFDPNDFFINPKNIKSNDRYTHLAVAAARQALKDGGLGDTPDTIEDPKRIGVMVGTAFGGMETFEQQTLKLAKNPTKPKVRPRYCINWEKCHWVLSELERFYDRCLPLPFPRC
jgi:3-oxoacyl-[acyl-carrier-protein] synthase II